MTMTPPNTVATTCPACGSVQAAVAPAQAEVTCSQCGVAFTATVADSEALNAVDEQGNPTVADPDAAEEYTGDDVRSRRESRSTFEQQFEFRSVGEPSSDGLTLEGYAAVFDQAVDIEDQFGKYRETIERGAFGKTIQERRPALLFDHGRHPMIGNMPIGTIDTIREDTRGLYVKARMSDSWLTEPVREAIRGRAITGMSVRMSAVKDQWSANASRGGEVCRSIREVSLPELGPVPFPAYEGTSVSMRSREALAALTDPVAKVELARLFASGTDLRSAVAENEPAAGHSFDQIRRRAHALLILS
jgi:HK97 family phage prohead protease